MKNIFKARIAPLVGIIVMIAVIGFSMTACSIASSPLPVAGGSTPPPPPDTSITYTSIDDDGNIYALEITDGASLSMGIISGESVYSPSGASLSMAISGEAVYAYAPKPNDSYKLTITLTDGTNKISTGTVKSFIEFVFTLLCGEIEFSVTVSGSSITSFSADIPVNGGGTVTKPTGDLKPFVGGTISGSYSYTDPDGFGSATITFSGGASGTFTMNATIFGIAFTVSGTYTVSGNTITCKVTDSDDPEDIGDTEIFTIIDEKTLRDEEKGDLWIKK